MMGYGYDGWGMMGGAGLLGVITWLVVIVDLVLVININQDKRFFLKHLSVLSSVITGQDA